MAGGRSPRTKKSEGGGDKTPSKKPQSAFNSGKFKKSPDFLKNMKKDNRHLVMVEGLQGGIVVAYFRKFNNDEEPFLGPYVKFLDDNPDVMENLEIAAIRYRRGIDGRSPMAQYPGTTWGWRQFIFVTGEDENTVEHREEIATRLLDHYNSKATTDLFPYPRKAKFGDDLTSQPMRSVDAALLDRDVIGMMSAAYPDTALTDLRDYEDIMACFWEDIEAGGEVIENYVNINFGDNNTAE